MLLVGAACLGICWGLERIDAWPSAWLFVVQWFWLSLVLAEFLRWTAYCWPDHENSYGVPLILLALGAWLAGKGKEQNVRAGSAIFWMVLLLFSAILLSGIKDIRPENLDPGWKWKDANLVTVMLIPAMGISLKDTVAGGKRWIWLYGGLTAAVVTGVLGYSAAMEADCGFYELSRSIRLLGIADRFESLVAAGMTLGYFVLIAYLLGTCGEGAERMKPGKGPWGVWSNAGLTALWFLWGFRLPDAVLAMGSILTWVVLPVLNCIQRNLQKM